MCVLVLCTTLYTAPHIVTTNQQHIAINVQRAS